MGRQAENTLANWQLSRLRTVHAGRKDYGSGRNDVTVLSYYWGANDAQHDTQFFRVESAFRETWLNCGLMRSVIVTDHPTREAERFAEDFPNVEIQIEPSLVPGSLPSMSRDCDGRLSDRFSTEYLLVVQDDGFPLRSGLDGFLGKWDFIGAPYVRDMWLPRTVACMLNLWTSNGGFSIRTHRMCELAAHYFRTRWHTCADQHLISEDIFYTETLPKHHWKYNRSMKIADNRSAIRFAWDVIVPQPITAAPFGFHRAETFVEIQKRMWAPEIPPASKGDLK